MSNTRWNTEFFRGAWIKALRKDDLTQGIYRLRFEKTFTAIGVAAEAFRKPLGIVRTGPGMIGLYRYDGSDRDTPPVLFDALGLSARQEAMIRHWNNVEKVDFKTIADRLEEIWATPKVKIQYKGH